MIPIRWRLTLWYLVLIGASLLGLVLISYRILSDSLKNEIELTLAERANHVTDAIAVVPNRPIAGISPEVTDEFRSPGVYLQLLDKNGEIIAHSFNLGTKQLLVTDSDLQQLLSGDDFYVTMQVDGQQIRVYQQPLRREGEVIGVVQVGQSLAGMETTLRRLRVIYTIGAAAVLLIGLVGGLGLAILGLRPVVRVTNTAREIIQAEDLTRRVNYTGPTDEIGTLATTFNQMLDRLHMIFEGQQRFLAEAAHELRTPLSTLLGNIDLLEQFGDNESRRDEIFAALRRTGRHVSRLLNDLLLLAQAEAGWHLHLQPVALDDLLLEVYETSQRAFNPVVLRLHSLEPAWVNADPDRLRQVIDNLLDNAMKFSPPESYIDLDLWRDSGNVCVRITDNGAGIHPDALPNIFDPFYRAPTENRKPGSGLGLTIVRWILHEHHGDVEITSTLGKGTIVTLSLPEYLDENSSTAP